MSPVVFIAVDLVDGYEQYVLALALRNICGIF